jgi:phosphoglycerate-specific signal transduction histidine kinase
MEAEIDIRIESIRQKLNYLSEEFKRDLNKIRQSWKTLIPYDEINKAKESMKLLKSFKEIQQKCIEMKELANECFSKLNDVS